MIDTTVQEFIGSLELHKKSPICILFYTCLKNLYSNVTKNYELSSICFDDKM